MFIHMHVYVQIYVYTYAYPCTQRFVNVHMHYCRVIRCDLYKPTSELPLQLHLQQEQRSKDRLGALKGPRKDRLAEARHLAFQLHSLSIVGNGVAR